MGNSHLITGYPDQNICKARKCVYKILVNGKAHIVYMHLSAIKILNLLVMKNEALKPCLALSDCSLKLPKPHIFTPGIFTVYVLWKTIQMEYHILKK